MARTPGEDSSSDSFHQEIKLMMYSLGDAQHPNPDSASLVEEITRQQMENILVQAIKVVHLRGSHTVSMEDFLFLLRKDKRKLRRLMRHLQLKDLIRAAISTKSTNTLEDEQETGVDDGFLPQAKKRKISIDFLNLLDTGFNDQIEPDKDEEERLEKQDALTSSMDSDEYVAYTKCRCVTFHKKAGKFKEWLKIGSYSELQPTQEVIEVLSYLAYETIVELSIQVKRDMESYYLDPSSAHNPHLPLPHSTTTDQLERQSVSSTATSSDSRNGDNPAVVDSTSLPTTPNSAAPDSHSGTNTTTRSTQDGRKRHRTASSASQETTPTVNNTAKNVTTDINRHSRAIEVVHIREAMRRYSFLAGPLTPLATHILNPTIKQRTLCL